MSYSAVGYIPAAVEGAASCPGGYVYMPAGATPTCTPSCPPAWERVTDERDTLCIEPQGTTLTDQCPEAFMVIDAKAGVSYCAAACPPGWTQDEEAGVEFCYDSGGPRPSPAAVRGAYPAASLPPSQAGVGLGAMPWWGYAAGAVAIIGLGVLFAR